MLLRDSKYVLLLVDDALGSSRILAHELVSTDAQSTRNVCHEALREGEREPFFHSSALLTSVFFSFKRAVEFQFLGIQAH